MIHIDIYFWAIYLYDPFVYFYFLFYFTPGPLGLPHACLEDIDMGGKVIPKNSLIIPHIMSAHYDQNFWSNPSEFKPERFISKDRRIIKHQAFYPFSMGKTIHNYIPQALKVVFSCVLSSTSALSFDMQRSKTD